MPGPRISIDAGLCGLGVEPFPSRARQQAETQNQMVMELVRKRRIHGALALSDARCAPHIFPRMKGFHWCRYRPINRYAYPIWIQLNLEPNFLIGVLPYWTLSD